MWNRSEFDIFDFDMSFKAVRSKLLVKVTFVG